MFCLPSRNHQDNKLFLRDYCFPIIFLLIWKNWLYILSFNIIQIQWILHTNTGIDSLSIINPFDLSNDHFWIKFQMYYLLPFLVADMFKLKNNYGNHYAFYTLINMGKIVHVPSFTVVFVSVLSFRHINISYPHIYVSCVRSKGVKCDAGQF